ncbi:hypothetical protein J2X09_002446 [Hydrogenophaga laconesensis]|uniref:Uncharacterized protein n=1 Tax=Hydrogenophaga laconesensis TaxID=1805971 RepID=A0ABU1VBL8_9BURK|nr:hypothetical protein [Hydrogenophaga laconesensis]
MTQPQTLSTQQLQDFRARIRNAGTLDQKKAVANETPWVQAA